MKGLCPINVYLTISRLASLRLRLIKFNPKFPFIPEAQFFHLQKQALLTIFSFKRKNQYICVISQTKARIPFSLFTLSNFSTYFKIKGTISSFTIVIVAEFISGQV